MDRLIFSLSLTLAVVLLVLLAGPMFAGKVYTTDDLGTFHLPLRQFYADCLRRGWDAEWMPHLYNGFYLHGEGQVGMFHPLHRLLYRLLPLWLAFDLELLLSYVCMFAGMALWLRVLPLHPGSSMFGALVFTFSGFSLLHFIHLNAIAVVAHIPWALYAIHVALRPTRPRPRVIAAAGLAAITGSQLLLGYPQYVWFSLLAEGVYAAGLARRAGANGLARVATAKLLGFLIGCVQLLPTWTTLRSSFRPDVPWMASSIGSLPPGNAAQLVAPYLWRGRFLPQVVSGVGPVGNTHEFGLYAGAATVALTAWLVVRCADLRRRAFAGAALLAAVIAFALACGAYTPLHRLLGHVPLVGGFRFPARYVALLHLALAACAALAMEDLLTAPGGGRPLRTWQRLVLWLPAIAGAGVTVAALTFAGGAATAPFLTHTATGTGPYLGPLLAVAAAALVTLAGRGRHWAVCLLVVLAALDQGAYGLSYVWRDAPRTVPEHRASLPAPPLPRDRRLDTPLFEGNIWTMNGYDLLQGYVALPPQRALDYGDPRALRIAGVTARQEPSAVQRFRAAAPWRPVAGRLPRARLVSDVRVTADPGSMLASIDPATTALVPAPLDVTPGAPGRADVARDEPGEIHVVTRAPSRQFLVVSERRHPGWQCRIDGIPAAVVPAYGDFLGCVAPAGRHTIAFTFEPSDIRAGGWMTVLGTGITALWLVWGTWHHRRSRSL